jgi:hypothetical protein
MLKRMGALPWMDSASIAAPATAERSSGALGPFATCSF